MNRFATSIVGGLMGMATGILAAHPAAPGVDALTVTWSGAACPAGIYTITTLVANQANNRTFTITTRDVKLPQEKVVQQLPDLPPGTYEVTATTSAGHSRTFASDAQVIGIYSPGQVVNLGARARPAARDRAGTARPRNAPVPPPRNDDPRATAPVDSVGSASGVIAGGSAGRRLLDPVLDRLLAALDPTGDDWVRFDAVDTDDDGLIDSVRIEFAGGETRVYAISRSAR
jgi:hypothetical protein